MTIKKNIRDKFYKCSNDIVRELAKEFGYELYIKGGQLIGWGDIQPYHAYSIKIVKGGE